MCQIIHRTCRMFNHRRTHRANRIHKIDRISKLLLLCLHILKANIINKINLKKQTSFLNQAIQLHPTTTLRLPKTDSHCPPTENNPMSTNKVLNQLLLLLQQIQPLPHNHQNPYMNHRILGVYLSVRTSHHKTHNQ